MLNNNYECVSSCESEVSRNYYLLNQEYLESRCQLENLYKQRINLSNLKLLGRYIKNGAFSRIKRRMRLSILRGDDLTNKYSLKEYQKFTSAKVAVYTCIWGNYDTIAEPMYINPSIDYFIITDQEIPDHSKWKRFDLSDNEEIIGMTPTEINRYCKMMAHKLFPEYEYSIYIDGNIRIITDMYPLISDMGERVIGIHSYQVDCIYNMKDAIIAGKKAKKKDVDRQIKEYRGKGFPEHFGAFECNVICRRHMDKDCISIMNDWWNEFNKFETRRDQLSLPYVVWKNGKTSDFIYSLGPDVRMNPRFRVTNEHIKL